MGAMGTGIARRSGMSVERPTTGTSTVDVLDRVLDKGIVIDAQVRVSVVGIHLVDVDARVIVASIETYLSYAVDVAAFEARAVVKAAIPPAIEPATPVIEPAPPAIEPATPARKPRRRDVRQRRRALVIFRCPQGCTFRRPPSPDDEAMSVTCPYRPDATCALRRSEP